MKLKNLLFIMIVLLVFTACSKSTKQEVLPQSPNILEVSVDDNQYNVVDMDASDYDKNITYSLNGTDSSNFNINSRTGEVTFKKLPEKLKYMFRVYAKDRAGNQSLQDVSININDKTAPLFKSKKVVRIEDNQLDVINIKVFDMDTNIKYSLKETAKEDFNINSKDGKVSLKKIAKQLRYEFSVIAKDSSGHLNSEDIVVFIKDKTAPLFISKNQINIEDDSLKVINIKTKDIDKRISYSLSGIDSSEFNINSVTGEIKLKKIATQLAYNFIVTAKDTAGNKNNQNITIIIKDKTEPSFISVKSLSVDEDQSNIITVGVEDIDSLIEYSILNKDSDKFDINSSTGEVSIKEKAEKLFYEFTVLAKDRAGNKSFEDIKIDIIDKTSPLFISKNVSKVEEEQLEAIKIKVEDIDKLINYSLVGGDSMDFNIDSSTGVVTFKQKPTKLSYIFTVVATDSSKNQSIQNIMININDKTAPSFLINDK